MFLHPKTQLERCSFFNTGQPLDLEYNSYVRVFGTRRAQANEKGRKSLGIAGFSGLQTEPDGDRVGDYNY